MNTESSALAQAIAPALVNESFVYQLKLKDYMLRILILGGLENKYDHRTKNLSPAIINYINTQIKAGHGSEICEIVQAVYEDSRAPKQDITMMVIALLCRAEDIEVRQRGLRLLEKFRTLSHLYTWKKFHADIVNPLSGEKSKGFGRAVKREINNWILSYRSRPMALAYQVTKYMAREGWSFKNILQCTHVRTQTGDNRTLADGKHSVNDVAPMEIDLVLRYAVEGFASMEKMVMAATSLCTSASDSVCNASVCNASVCNAIVCNTSVYEYIKAVHDAKQCTMLDSYILIPLIYKHKLTREQVPTWGLADTKVLTALLTNKQKTRVTMPLTALLRNLGNLTAHHVFQDEEILHLVMTHLVDPDMIKTTHIHPVNILMAWFIYKKGTGNHGRNTWSPHPQMSKTLEEMFYLSFKNVAPTGKRICFLIDCSGSMSSGSLCEGVTNAEAAALLAMIFARSETLSSERTLCYLHSFYLFTSNRNKSETGLFDVSGVIDDHASFETVLSAVQRSDWGKTDISLGILEALKYKRKYDAFVVITDNDVNSGIKPSEAMKQYREGMKMPHAKLVVVATQGSVITIADPNDVNMMDICGFDSHGPQIMQDFIRQDF